MSMNTVILLTRKLLGKSNYDKHRRCTSVASVVVGQFSLDTVVNEALYIITCNLKIWAELLF